MKSSTIRRSNLSREKIAVLEALSNYKQESVYDNSPSVYVRPHKEKEKELDLLWQNFKISQKSDKSPSVYLATGFIAGAICMFLLTSVIHFSVKDTNVVADNAKIKAEKVENNTVNLLPASEEKTSASTETYLVQSGDTVESIIIRFYGSYSPAKAAEIQRINELPSLDKLQIGQKLIMPIE